MSPQLILLQWSSNAKQVEIINFKRGFSPETRPTRWVAGKLVIWKGESQNANENNAYIFLFRCGVNVNLIELLAVRGRLAE